MSRIHLSRRQIQRALELADHGGVTFATVEAPELPRDQGGRTLGLVAMRYRITETNPDYALVIVDNRGTVVHDASDQETPCD